jgi:hypothetical protein
MPDIRGKRLLDSAFTAMRPTCIIEALCGTNSVVECNLAKVEVAGSNPVSRSFISIAYSLLLLHQYTSIGL